MSPPFKPTKLYRLLKQSCRATYKRAPGPLLNTLVAIWNSGKHREVSWLKEGDLILKMQPRFFLVSRPQNDHNILLVDVRPKEGRSEGRDESPERKAVP
jgi:hypothetical protein